MSNVFDYLDWRGDLTFEQAAFNEIDALILAITAYIHYPDSFDEPTSFKEALQKFYAQPAEDAYRGFEGIKDDIYQLLKSLEENKRFNGLYLSDYRNIFIKEPQEQFAAMTYHLADHSLITVFRGTDSTLVGWKEDFNMALDKPVPAQLSAAAYLEEISDKYGKNIIVTGHSKGANLAVFAASQLKDKDRLLNIYCNDGPGFSDEFINSGEFKGIEERIKAYMPAGSIVGGLMIPPQTEMILSNGVSILQHDPFSWQLKGTHFLKNDQRPAHIKAAEKALNEFWQKADKDELKSFIDSIYKQLDKFDTDFQRTIKKLKSLI